MISRRSFLTLPLMVAVPRPVLAQAEPFPIHEFDKDLVDYKFRRQVVDYATQEPQGTIIVDPAKRWLYYVMGGGKATRFGISTGKYGSWAGTTVIGKMEKWPVWTPTPDHLKRNPQLIKYIGGMPGGPKNPMGARALYLYQNTVDTTYRIHGTDVPTYIGTKATAGCFGMLNYDVVMLFNAVRVGTRVVVLPT